MQLVKFWFLIMLLISGISIKKDLFAVFYKNSSFVVVMWLSPC